MKVRIRGNSVRYRLTKSEVEQLKLNGFYQEETQFAANTFTYLLKADNNVNHLEASFENNILTIFVPKTDADSWFETEKIGHQHDFKQSNGESLFLLIEKDFVCLDETVEDQSDNYPHPLEEGLK